MGEITRASGAILVVLGAMCGLVALGWAVYLSYNSPTALPNNAVPLAILLVVALILIVLGLSRD